MRYTTSHAFQLLPYSDPLINNNSNSDNSNNFHSAEVEMSG